MMGLCRPGRWLESSIIQVFPNLDGSIITACSWAASWCHKGPGCCAILPSFHKQTPLTRHKTSVAPKVPVANNHQSSVVAISRPRHGSHAAPSHLWPALQNHRISQAGKVPQGSLNPAPNSTQGLDFGWSCI